MKNVKITLRLAKFLLEDVTELLSITEDFRKYHYRYNKICEGYEAEIIELKKAIAKSKTLKELK
jgi:hypothetical protein